MTDQDHKTILQLSDELKKANDKIAKLRSLFLCPRHDEGREDCCSCNDYLVLALDRCDDVLCWWRPNDCGYTIFIEDAGRYTEEQITKKASYYDNGEALAVPLREVCQNTRMVAYKDSWGASLMNKAEEKKKEELEKIKEAVEFRDRFWRGECPECGIELHAEQDEEFKNAWGDKKFHVECPTCDFKTEVSTWPPKNKLKEKV